MKSDKIKEFAANVHFLSFKKGGKIQTGLNCEYDVLSEACLSLSHSSAVPSLIRLQISTK
jgi:hypothetical protein